MLNRITCLLILTFLGFACEKNKNCEGSASPVGEWEMVAQYSDPGDGSGDYVPVDSERRYVFNADGTFSSNRTLCQPFDEDSGPSFGSWTDTTSVSWATGEIRADSCDEWFQAYWELIDDGCTLQVSYLCIEGCGQRFERR